MKYYGLLLTILLTGCSTTVPVVAKFPEAPASLKATCPELKKIEGDTISIVDLHKTVVENYTQYYECATKVEAWNEWYTKQKKIFNEVK
jgi:hypothetical protein